MFAFLQALVQLPQVAKQGFVDSLIGSDGFAPLSPDRPVINGVRFERSQFLQNLSGSCGRCDQCFVVVAIEAEAWIESNGRRRFDDQERSLILVPDKLMNLSGGGICLCCDQIDDRNGRGGLRVLLQDIGSCKTGIARLLAQLTALFQRQSECERQLTSRKLIDLLGGNEVV